MSGKTTELKKRYLNLLKSGINSDNIRVFTSTAQQGSKWRESINVSAAGKLNIYTFFGFVQRELRRYWNLVNANHSVEPIFINIESSQFPTRIVLINYAKIIGSFKSMPRPGV
ncbi:UvrD-helicase domain-containing protein [Desulfofarcimen acetoxidans]|uniref:UvrD-helicase domain-containing protein n=1 Tax=Desulfofarcimen acetoxidans TaxID=58138 RepID=UPI00019E4B1E|nr:UvrD-helicase domain-containing protein [Desulfofarcimen acetoxidans]